MAAVDPAPDMKRPLTQEGWPRDSDDVSWSARLAKEQDRDLHGAKTTPPPPAAFH